MDWFDFFYPEQAQAKYLRRIAAKQSIAPNSLPNQSSRHEQDILSLKNDVKFLTLVLMAILKRLGETETLSLTDLKDLLDEIDKLDGLADGGLEPAVLKGLLGVVQQAASSTATAEETDLKLIAETVRRHRK